LWISQQRELQVAKTAEEALTNKLSISKERVEQLEAQVVNLQTAQQELSALIAKNDQSENGLHFFFSFSFSFARLVLDVFPFSFFPTTTTTS